MIRVADPFATRKGGVSFAVENESANPMPQRSIFYDMHPNRSFQSWRDFEEVNRMLHEAIERGYVEAVTPLKAPDKLPTEEFWYRDKETGVIYKMSPPNPPARGLWERVDLDDYIAPDSSIQ